MHAVVVYDSLYGNTHAVADAIAEGLRAHGEAAVLKLGDADAEAVAAADLLVVGGPTHVHGVTSKLSHKAGADGEHEHLDEAATGPALKDWLKTLAQGNSAPAVAFDTRMSGSTLKTGAASKSIARRLRRHGYEVVADPESFVVEGAEGPLREGELERARAWGEALGAQ